MISTSSAVWIVQDNEIYEGKVLEVAGTSCVVDFGEDDTETLPVSDLFETFEAAEQELLDQQASAMEDESSSSSEDPTPTDTGPVQFN